MLPRNLLKVVKAAARPALHAIRMSALLSRSLLLSLVARSLSLLEDYVYMSRKTPRWLAPCSLVLALVLARSLSRSLAFFALSRRSLAFALRRLRIHVSQDHVRLQVAGKIVVVVRALISFARMLLLR